MGDSSRKALPEAREGTHHPAGPALAEMESAVHEAVLAYCPEQPDESARVAPLLDLLAFLSWPPRLRSACSELSRTRRFLDYAYLHNNGFYVVYLTDPDIGLQVRLHVWSPRHPPRREQPHRHRMGFVSRVLTGALQSTVFERMDTLLESSEDDQCFQELRIEAPVHSDFDADQAVIEPGPTVVLRPKQRLVHRAGDTYVFPAAGIHRVDTPEALSEPVVTLTIWEPAFQASIAYEPVQSVTQAQTMAVRRPSRAVYDELIALVRNSLGEPW